MKILVAVKRVIDYNVKIRVKPDGTGIETENVKMSMNPFDEVALEQAVRLKESGVADEIVVITVGNDKCTDVLRSALAMGADRAIHVLSDKTVQTLGIAKILAKIADNEKPDLILLGKQAIDTDDGQVGAMLAGLLDIPQALNVSTMTIDGCLVSVSSTVDDGIEQAELSMPCVITVDLHLNKPRYASLPLVLKARSKPLVTVSVDEYGLDVSQRIISVKVEEPSGRNSCVMLDNAEQLVEIIKSKARGI